MAKGIEEKKEDILAVRFGGLGDLLIVLPSIQLIKRNMPQAQITLIARMSYGRFFKEAEVIDVLLPLEDNRASLLFQEGGGISGYSPSDFDLVLIWLNKEPSETRKIWQSKFKEKMRLIIGSSENNQSLVRYFF